MKKTIYLFFLQNPSGNIRNTVALEKDGATSPTLTKQFYSLINVDQKATIVIPGICICVPVDPGGPVDP